MTFRKGMTRTGFQVPLESLREFQGFEGSVKLDLPRQ